MKLSLAVVLTCVAVAAGCGPKPKPAEPVPLPDIPKADADPANDPQDPPSPEPEVVPAKPMSFALPARNLTLAVIKAGGKKRSIVKLSPVGRQVVQVRVGAQLEIGGQAQSTPELRVEMGLEPGAADTAGTTAMTGTFLTAQLYVGSERISEADALLAGLLKGKLTGAISSDGQWRDFSLDIEAGQPELVDVMETLGLGFSPRLVFPSSPIGVGATWTVSSPLDFSGIALTETTTFTLASLDGKTAKVTGKTVVTGNNQAVSDGGTPVDVSGIAGVGTADYTVDLDHAAATGTSNTQTNLTISADGESIPTKLSFSYSHGLAMSGSGVTAPAP